VLLVSCLVYSSALKMEAFQRLQFYYKYNINNQSLTNINKSTDEHIGIYLYDGCIIFSFTNIHIFFQLSERRWNWRVPQKEICWWICSNATLWWWRWRNVWWNHPADPAAWSEVSRTVV
jgi:hypothetical protein